MRNELLLLALLPLGLSAQINNFSWPMDPVNEQHRISATFDECREDRDHFHNGTDMPLAPGEEALSIMPGTVLQIGPDWIRVEDFAYVHVIPNGALHVNDEVNQGAVVGWTDIYAHIHLNYGGGASGHASGNPLLPGKITPFYDPYHPRSPIIQFVMDGTFAAFPSNNLSGRVDIIAQAADTTDLWASIDMNNGIYTIGWALYSADMSEVLDGPHFWFEADELYSNSYINNVYAPGSSTSIYRYIVTNRINTNGYLDCASYEAGPYVVSVMSSDTRDNWDTTYVPVNLSDIDVLPTGQPELEYIGPNDSGDLRFEWSAPTDVDLAGYILEFSFDGENWSSNHGPDILTADMTSFVVEGFPQNSYLKFRLIAVDDAPIPNHSESSDTYGVKLNASGDAILIVDGFDRTNGSWTQTQHDFACYYSDAVAGSDPSAAISSASNEWVSQGGNLDDFAAVIWFVGDDSQTDETFSSEEQSVISAYLAAGGNFFASGAEIGYDLSAGSTADESFMNQNLHLAYVGDDAGSYQVQGVGTHFSGIDFTYGSLPYEEDWPDHFAPVQGGEVALQYGNSLNAAISYRDETSATFVMGLSFETIDGAIDRNALMGRVLQYFARTSDIDDIQIPLTLSISSIYPNPFNASVNIAYDLDQPGKTTFTIYDIQGRSVFTQVFSNQQSGQHIWSWNGVDQTGKVLSSGAYLVRLTLNDRFGATQKLLLVK
ncbi:T9SS type A sorting domain-containing protein [bacterium]|nr:T9SS type A sorting domain-containing protein [bacterium]